MSRVDLSSSQSASSGSLSSTAERLWASRSGALLGAAGTNQMILAALPEELARPYETLARALRIWWPGKVPDKLVDIYWDLFPGCFGAHIAAFGTPYEALSQLANTGANLQMAASVGYAGRILPEDSFTDLNAKDFIQWLERVVAAQERVDAPQMNRRLTGLLEVSARRWRLQLKRSAEIGWSWDGAPLNQLPEHLRSAASHIDAGGKWSWSAVNKKNSLKLAYPGGEEVLPLRPGDLTALASAIPALSS